MNFHICECDDEDAREVLEECLKRLNWSEEKKKVEKERKRIAHEKEMKKIDKWVAYMKSVPDKVWSAKHARIVNRETRKLIEKAKKIKLLREFRNSKS